MADLYRTQILLEREQHSQLSEIAESEGVSISELIRTAVARFLDDRRATLRYEQELKALERLTALREKIVAQYGIYEGDLLDEVREERDEDFERIWRGEA